MMKLQTYAVISLFSALALVYHAFSSRAQFYPAMVYLSTSKISLVLLLNMGLVLMCILWQLTKRVFLGSLREAEVERLNEQSWREVMEMLFVITIFRQDFSVSFLAMVTALLLIKALHWLAQKRIEYIETTPSVPLLSHARIVSFIGFLLLVDCLFLYSSLKYLFQTRQASVTLFFAFEYIILATTTVSIFVKYAFYVSDMLMEGQWERKAVYTFYLELIRDLLHLSMYLCFFLVIFVNYGVPLHLIRELYETFRNFKIRIADYMRYRRITSNMNGRFPDATAEELSASDATCIICREEMTTAKKLLCGHLFHVHCLRSWLERQNTCPTCRAPVVTASEVGGRIGPHGHHSNNAHQQTGGGGGGGSMEMQGGTPRLTGQQVRLQAAAAAASLYEKSFVYPPSPPNVLAYCTGYARLPSPSSSFSDTESAASAGGQHTSSSPIQYDFVPFQPPFAAVAANKIERNGDDVSLLLETQKRLLQQQIEALQRQLELLEESKEEEAAAAANSSDGAKSMSSGDSKGKSVASSS